MLTIRKEQFRALEAISLDRWFSSEAERFRKKLKADQKEPVPQDQLKNWAENNWRVGLTFGFESDRDFAMYNDLRFQLGDDFPFHRIYSTHLEVLNSDSLWSWQKFDMLNNLESQPSHRTAQVGTKNWAGVELKSLPLGRVLCKTQHQPAAM
jgi:hypothetical protein